MSGETFRSILRRVTLARYFGEDRRVIRAFEEQAAAVESSQAAAEAATTALEDASVLTLSPNAALKNERLFKVDPNSMALANDGQSVTIRAKVGNSTRFKVTIVPAGDTTLLAPLSGTLVTAEAEQTLSAKTLNTPILTGLANAADDAGASAAGVPVGGVYHNAGVLRVRLA